MLYKTTDYGKTWSDISAGHPEDDYTRVIRADPGRVARCYTSAPRPASMSPFDDGAAWQPLQANLPCVPVYDLLIKDDDLIAATHGRSFWILDDLTQVRQIADDLLGQPFHLLKPRDTYRPASAFRNQKPTPGKNYQRGVGGYVAYTETKGAYGDTVLNFLDAGANPPEGVIVTYYLREKPSSDITLSFLDAQGQLIKAYSSSMKASDTATANKTPELRAPAEAGMNRFIWPMRYPEARLVPGDKLLTDKVVGPLAPPGTYQVRLDVNGTPQTQTFALVKDPRVAASQADFDAQFALLLHIRDKLSTTHDAVNTLRRIRQQVDEWTQRAAGHSGADAVSQAAQTVKDKLVTVEDALIQVNTEAPAIGSTCQPNSMPSWQSCPVLWPRPTSPRRSKSTRC